MLCIEPLAGIVAGDGKVPALSQSPNDVAGAAPVGVIEFENPALISHRKQKITVSGVNQSIAVRPVRQSKKGTTRIQVIKSRPEPNGVSIRIDIDHNISLHAGGSLRALQSRQGLCYVRKRDPVPVGKNKHVMVKIINLRNNLPLGLQ